MANTNSFNNQIDLGAIYGIDGCGAGGCGISNTIAPQNPHPTLEQITSYVGRNEQPQQQAPQPNERDFSSSSPIEGDLSQMYQPISQQTADMYPTPAIVMAENEANANTANMANTASTAIGNNSTGNLITDFSNPYPVTRESIQYLNGFIRTQIGRRVTIDFLIGSNTIESKSGYLLAVAANYILLNELDTNDITACDFYNIKFIRFYY